MSLVKHSCLITSALTVEGQHGCAYCWKNKCVGEGRERWRV